LTKTDDNQASEFFRVDRNDVGSVNGEARAGAAPLAEERVRLRGLALGALAAASISTDRVGLQVLFLLIGSMIVAFVLYTFATGKKLFKPQRG